METDQWYDEQGVWTGSATILPDGQLVVLYTGSTNESVQVQNLAYPADPSDPLLINWVKYPGNPVLVPPPGIDGKDFRDPTTAWNTPQGKWRITIGSKINKIGISLVYDTEDFKTFELLDGVLHAVPGTGMWECVDFYPISKQGENGLDTSVDGPGVKHVVKASMDDDRNDYYAIGSYDAYKGKWTPNNPTLDIIVNQIQERNKNIFPSRSSLFTQAMATFSHIIVVFAILAMVLLPSTTMATDYVVGDESGWTVNYDYQAWAKNKIFYVGDKLVFKYPVNVHNVYKVNASSFANCTIPAPSTALTSGNDVVPLLASGKKWYICGVEEHCSDFGQKLTIDVLQGSLPPAPAPSSATMFGYQTCMAISSVLAMIFMF
ncbi:hypothetical protein L1887_01146 [Cichorium endivia]|nr:hypothetical protein L1887_01146 [Cichorium endivia]